MIYYAKYFIIISSCFAKKKKKKRYKGEVRNCYIELLISSSMIVVSPFWNTSGYGTEGKLGSKEIRRKLAADVVIKLFERTEILFRTSNKVTASSPLPEFLRYSIMHTFRGILLSHDACCASATLILSLSCIL